MATTTRDAYGPYHKHPPVAAFNSISERCFDRYHEITNRFGWKNFTAEQHIILLMLYVAESTSYSVRLTSSWGSSLPAMSLCRNRYEQTVRFSYLAHQQDYIEWNKFLVDFVRQKNALGRRLNAEPDAKSHYEQMVGGMEGWETELFSKKRHQWASRWQKIGVETCAKKRDIMVRENGNLPSFIRTQLASFYISTYAQFSSVSHYDFYSLTMLRYQNAPDGRRVLAPEPWWPAMLHLHVALFDIIQTAECLWRHFRLTDFAYFNSLYDEWNSYRDKMGLSGCYED